MNNNKYYTPDISEFYVGFEYEELEFIYTDKGWYTAKEQKWLHKVYKGNDYIESYYLNEQVKRSLFTNSIRVKYLDKSDVEELGFEETESMISGYDHFELHPIFKETNSKGKEVDIQKYFGIYVNRKDYRFVLIYGGSFNNAHPNTDTYRFKGIIKNKSELKQVLRMIGITDDKQS